MRKHLLFLIGGLSFCTMSNAATPDLTGAFLSPTRNLSTNSVKVSKTGDIRFDTNAGPKRAKSLAPKEDNSDDLYNVNVLLNEDFASLGAGNMENPTAVNITEENGDLKGLPGWSGVNVYDAGQAVYVDMKFIIYEEWGFGEPEGEIWTAPVRDVAGKTLRLKVNAKGAYTQEDIEDEFVDNMNCIFMAYTDALPGERRMIDFPYFNISEDFETEEVTLDIPETMTFYNEDDEEVECPISAVRVKLQPMRTPYFISSLELATVSPKVAIPDGLSFCNFSADGYTAVWNAVEGADKYKVEFYTSKFDVEEYAFALTSHSVAEVTETSANVTIPTDDPTFFKVTAYAGEQPSPASEMTMVYSALPPEMKEAKIADGKVTVSWNAAKGAAGTEIFAYRQVNVGESGKDYSFLDIDFSNAPDEEDGSDILWLDDYAYGWAALPYPSFEDGAVVINNSGAMWGMPTAKLISTNTYDFSKTSGKVKMIVTAKTTDYAGMVVGMGGTDPATGETVTLDADETDLTTEFADYEFELEGKNAETMFLVQADNSLGTLAVRRIQIIADFEDNSEIGYPYFGDFTDKESISFPVPTEKYERVKAVGRTIKQVNVEEMGHVFTIAEAVSVYSEPIYTDRGLGVANIEDAAEHTDFYTIDGRKVNPQGNAAPGIYIEKKGEKVTKRIVK